MSKERPDRAGHLVRQGHDHDIKRSALAKFHDRRWPILGLGQHGSGPMNQSRAKIRVASLTEAQQAHTATGAGLARHPSQPGRKFPSRLEGAGIADRRYRRRGDEEPHPRNGGSSLTGWLLMLPDLQAPLNLANLQV